MEVKQKQVATPKETAAVYKAVADYAYVESGFAVYKDGLDDQSLIDRIIAPALGYDAETLKARRRAIWARVIYVRKATVGHVRTGREAKPIAGAGGGGSDLEAILRVEAKLDKLLDSLGLK